MLRRALLLVFSLSCVVPSWAQSADPQVATTPHPPAAAGAPRPNIVFFYVDDLGWQDTELPMLEAATDLNRRFRTPNLRKLAEQGVLFTDAHGAAVCSPSRVSLMTGMSPARHGVTNWTLRANTSPDRVDGRLGELGWPLNGLAAEPGTPRTVVAKPLAQLLQDAGYYTLHVGKAHFGAIGTPGEDPKNLGFVDQIAGHAAGGPGSYLGKHDFSAAWRSNPPEHVWDVPGLEQYHGQDVFLTQALTDLALETLDGQHQAQPQQPFFLYLSHYAVHAPFEVDPRFAANYPNLTGHELAFATLVEGVDRSLGQVMAWLEANHLTENTLLVVHSDNGTPEGLHATAGLRGAKRDPYEAGHRVPLVVRWPGHTAAGTRNASPVIIEDWFPSLVVAAGAQPRPADLPQTIDGQNLLPLLGGDAPESWAQRPLLWHFPHLEGSQKPNSAMRIGPWKLIWFYLDQRLELYNLADDLAEKHNLADAEPAIRARMVNQMNELLRQRGALLPVNPQGQPLALPEN